MFFWATWAAFFIWFSVTDASFSLFQYCISPPRRFYKLQPKRLSREAGCALIGQRWRWGPGHAFLTSVELKHDDWGVFSGLHMFNPPLSVNAVNGTFGVESERQKAHSKGVERIFLVSIKCQTYKRKKKRDKLLNEENVLFAPLNLVPNLFLNI